MITSGCTATLGLYDNASEIRKKADISYVDSKVDPLQAGHKGYATLAQAQVAQSGLAANTVVEVLSDTTEANNGYYLWNGTTLTKTTFSPLVQANNYTDSKVATAKAEAIATANNYTDSRYNSLVVETEQFANQAEAAATAANIAGKVYATPAEGVVPVTGVPSGQYFNVRSSSNDNYIDEYLNNGGVAQATGKSYPSSAYVQNIENYVAKPFVTGKIYALNSRVQLSNGDIVRSTVAANTVNPNVDMTGWVKVNAASQILDESGNSLQQVIDEKLYPISTPKMFGAVGDGIVDDSNALQNFFNSLNNKSGDVSGTYKITKRINIPHKCSVVAKYGEIIIESTRTDNFFVLGSDGIVLDGIVFNQITEVAQTSLYSGSIINSVGNKGIVIKNCIGKSFYNSFITMIEANNCVVHSNQTTPSVVRKGSFDIVFYDGGSFNQIYGNSLLASSRYGIGIQTTETNPTVLRMVESNFIANNTVQNKTVYGIMLYRRRGGQHKFHNNMIVGNIVSDISGDEYNSATSSYTYGAGIYVQGANNTRIIGGMISRTHTKASTQAFSETLALGAIGLINVVDAHISGVTINDAELWGIYWSGEGDGTEAFDFDGSFTVSDCAINNSVQKSAIYFKNTTKPVFVSGTSINKTGQHGILFNEQTTTNNSYHVDNCAIKNIGQYGVYGASTSIKLMSVKNSLIEGVNITTTGYGVLMPALSKCIIDNVSVKKCGKGISTQALSGYVDNCSVTDSTLGFEIRDRKISFGKNNSASSNTTNFGGVLTSSGLVIVEDATTISAFNGSGVITSSTVATQIDTITGGQVGWVMTIMCNIGAGKTIKYDVNKIILNGQADFVMRAKSTITLMYMNSLWFEVGRSY